MITKEACNVRLTCIAYAAVSMLLLISANTASEASESFESRCAVKNTVVNFHCPDIAAWRINYLPPLTPGPVTFTTNNETGLKEDMHIVTNQEYLRTYGNVSLIMCIPREGNAIFAILAITDPSQPELQLLPTLIPQSWTSLYLEWESPEYEFELPHVDYNYTITMSGDDGYFEVMTVVVNGSETPSLYLDLGGYECVQLNIHISLPGNCAPTKIPAALLLDPPYPMPRGVEVVVLNTTSLALTWEHPENLFSDDHFNYSVSAVVVSTGDVISQYTISFSSSHTPWEEFDLSGSVDACEEINFTLSLVGDCRVIHTTAALPIYPEDFPSEEIDVAILFSVDLSLQKIEIMLKPPNLCPTQTAYYILTFTNQDDDITWSTERKLLQGTSGVVEEVIQPDRFELDKNYSVTITITTIVGNVSTNATFNICTLLGGAPRDLSIQSFGRNNAQLSWQKQCSTSALPVTYEVTAVLVSNRDTIERHFVPVLPDEESPTLQLRMEQYACCDVNYTVRVFGHEEMVSVVEALPAYPTTFEEGIGVDFSLNVDGTFKEVELEFTPPKLCEFQNSSYMLSYTDGGKTWTRDPVPITDTNQPIKEEIESGIDKDTMYTVTVTVVTDFGSISSNATFVRDVQTGAASTISTSGMPGVPVYIIVVAMVAALVCGVIGGIIVLYCLRQRKRRREKKKEMSKKKMVANPLYEAAEDHYEHLPDSQTPPFLSVQAATPTPLSRPGESKYTDIAPILPPPRKDFEAAKSMGEKPSVTDTQEKSPKRASSMHIPETHSLGGMSAYSAEDCYTIMSPAGTVTMLPRNTSSSNPSTSVGASDLATPAANDAKCMD